MGWIELGRLVVARFPVRWLRTCAALSAQSTVEYALVGALVVIAAAGALSLLGGELTAVFTNITNTLRGSAGPR
jgi:Flp pilus assembly pilin Flp